MSEPLIVYLDSQDYSKFADAEAGHGNLVVLPVLKQLRELTARGEIRIVYSAMNLSELLQYDGGGRELTLRKAKLVESLAGRHAFFDAGRLMGHQIATAAMQAGLIDKSRLPLRPISATDEWFPVPDELFRDIESVAAYRRKLVQTDVWPTLANRASRRSAMTIARRMRVAEAPDALFAPLLEKYPFSIDLMKRTLGRYLDGKVSAEHARDALLSEMGRPSAFVVWYFEHARGKKDFPYWLRGIGNSLESVVLELRAKSIPLAGLPGAAEKAQGILKDLGRSIPRSLASRFGAEAAPFGLTDTVRGEFLASDDALLNVPFLKLMSILLPDYLLQHTPFRTIPRKPRRSDGGDIFHAMTLPYCDVWRGDRYFVDLVRKHTSGTTVALVDDVLELPDAIRRRLSERN